MTGVASYLDCGCAILENGRRSWCPSCTAKAEASPKPLQAVVAAEDTNTPIPVAQPLYPAQVTRSRSPSPHPQDRSTMQGRPPAIPASWQRKRLGSEQYAAAAFIFDFLPRAWSFTDDGGVRKAELLDAARAWSHGEQILIKSALDLYDPGCVEYHGHTPAGVGEIAGVLGDEFFDVLLRAVRIARGDI